MKKINSLWIVALMMTSLTGCQQSEKAAKPNILYIMSDDHTAQAFGVYGSRLAELNPTPNIDRLAHEGMLFSNTFCNNSICTPSRASIITGQYCQTNGVLDLAGKIEPERQYLAHEIKKQGYETAVIGKWHLKEKPEAFDYYNVLYSQGDYFNPVLYEKGQTSTTMALINGKEKEMVGTKYEGHSSDVITDLSLKWLKNRDDSKPFFLLHQFKAPHDMFEFAPRYADYLADVEIPEPANMYDNTGNGSIATRGENDELIHDIGSSISHRNPIRNMGMHMDIDPNIPDPEYTHQAYQEYLKRYLRCVKGVDDNFKRIIDHLEEMGELDNTIIIYTGDQGFMLGEHDYIDKRWMYEESMRMPLLVRYPKSVKAGSKSDALISNTDFAPTMIELAGGTVPEYMQGKSFKSILETGNEPENWRKAAYYRYWMHMAHKHANPAHFGIRTKEYKLIFFYGIDYKVRDDAPIDFSVNPESRSDFQTPAAWELYDMKNDPFEMNNLYGKKGYEEITKELKALLKSTREEINETDKNYPAIQKIIEENWDI